jgi:hypothetical protein
MIVSAFRRSREVDAYNEDDPRAFRDYILHDTPAINELIRGSHARVALFKPIMDTYRTNRLLEDFPTARVLFIFRHFDDVVNSWTRKAVREGKPDHHSWVIKHWVDADFEQFRLSPPAPDVCEMIRRLQLTRLNEASCAALCWIFWNRCYFDLPLDRNPRVRLIQYDTLVRNPDREFASICGFAGVRFHPSLVEAVHAASLRKSAPPPLAPEVRSTCEGLWERLCAELPIDHGSAGSRHV